MSHGCAEVKFAFVGLFFPNFLNYQLHVCYQEVVGGGRREVLNTTEQGAGGRRVVGGGDARPLNYLFAPLLFQALEKKAKGVQKGREKVIVSQPPVTKRRISRRI